MCILSRRQVLIAFMLTFMASCYAPTGDAFNLPRASHVAKVSPLSSHNNNNEIANSERSLANNSRRSVISKIVIGCLAGVSTNINNNKPAYALVEGNVPPKKQVKALSEEYRQGTAALGDSVEAEVLPREAYNKLDSGVIYADISVGSGDPVKEGSKVNLQWVLRRSNGYFVDSSAVSDSIPFIFTVGKGDAIAGCDEGIRGMRVGGTRRILIPPRLAWIEGIQDGKPGPLPAGFGPRQQMRRVMETRIDVPGEYIFLEVKVTKVR